jgi:hypothetical protein
MLSNSYGTQQREGVRLVEHDRNPSDPSDLTDHIPLFAGRYDYVKGRGVRAHELFKVVN